MAPADARWLIREVWTRAGVGILGGQAKLGKSWLGLDISVSVASGTPCLGHYPVEDAGPALVYLAEDALADVRSRLDALCAHRSLDLRRVDLNVITAPVLRLDQTEDQQRLAATLEALRPRVLVLDPLVRLHRLDENASADMAVLLG
ncbi:MAG: AAA family ATPase, partial [Myxococcota bacterium]